MSGGYGGLNAYGSGKYFGGTYAGADAYLRAGKNANYRSIAKNAYLGRQQDGSISLTLHNTAIVTYHENNTFTLYHDGWTTVTTKSYINGNVPFHVGSSYNKKYPGWSLGDSGEYTPARVQKCRTCHGEGGEVRRRECRGAPRWRYNGDDMCPGATEMFAVAWDFSVSPDNWEKHWDSRYTQPCLHGERFERPHPLGFCEHGRREAHPYGEIEAHECRRCYGEGIVDYGSQPIPIIWDGGAVLMAADGTVLARDVQRYHPTGKASKAYLPYVESPAAEYAKGIPDVNRTLESLLPAMLETVYCPDCAGAERHANTITNLVMHLNDTRRWTRESIADWLDTLDADLRFPTPIGA